jgi:hypothetical protein
VAAQVDQTRTDKKRGPAEGAQRPRRPQRPARRNIAKVDASMLSRVATLQWTGQNSAAAPRDTWGNAGIFG